MHQKYYPNKKIEPNHKTEATYKLDSHQSQTTFTTNSYSINTKSNLYYTHSLTSIPETCFSYFSHKITKIIP